MPAVEVAVAVTGTVLETVARFAGAVIEAETPVVLTVSVTGIVCGELEAAGSLIVAVALYVPRARVAGFTTKDTLVVALPTREPDIGLNVSHDGCVLDADQLRVVPAPPMFFTTTDCVEVAVLPCAAGKLSVEVETERTAWFDTVTVIEVEVAVLL
jgi:hypothetical protein